MSNIKAVFTPQGIVIGDATENLDGTIILTDPVLAIPQRDNVALIPFLALMEEKSVTFKEGEYQYGRIFTPALDLRNHYSKMFGRIEEVSVGNILQFS